MISSSRDEDILNPTLSTHSKANIVSAVWNVTYRPDHFIQNPGFAKAYLRYYIEQCRIAAQSKGLNTIIDSHADIVGIIKSFRDFTMPRKDIKNRILAQIPQPMPDDANDVVCEVIDLCVRLTFMIDVGKIQYGFVPGQRPLIWEDGSVKDFLQKHLGSATFAPLRIVRVKLDRLFTARNLDRIAGLQIVWTDNLTDHLRLMVDDTRVAIFHHASFLEANRESSAFPTGFVEETLQTLALLFPQYDKKTCNWFLEKQKKFGLDCKASTFGHLTTEERQIENFVFWHDRLGILKQVFDEAEPSTIAQWWSDRRRRVQWYTFWVAAIVLTLTILFGMIQCLEGALQVYKAYYPS